MNKIKICLICKRKIKCSLSEYSRRKVCSRKCLSEYYILNSKKFLEGKMPKGEQSPHWKGDNIGFVALHQWLQRTYGKASECENANCPKISKRFNWSLLRNKKYERKRENFWQLCVSCHRRYDKIII